MIDQDILEKIQGFDDKKVLIQSLIKPLTDRGIFAAQPELNRFLYKNGNHQYEHFRNDIDKFLPMMKDNSIIIVNNYNMFDGVNHTMSERFRKPIRIFKESSWMVTL